MNAAKETHSVWDGTEALPPAAAHLPDLPLPTPQRLTLEETLFARWDFDHRGNRTPWHAGWERAVYERVVVPLWPFLGAGLATVLADGRLRAGDVLARVPAVARAATIRHPPAVQEQFLDAAGVPFEADLGEIERGCPCTFCRGERRWRAHARYVPPEHRLRLAFMDELVWHVGVVLRTPNAYDRRHGAPLRDWRDWRDPRQWRDWRGERTSPATFATTGPSDEDDAPVAGGWPRSAAQPQKGTRS